jgi:hypothetical protein
MARRRAKGRTRVPVAQGDPQMRQIAARRRAGRRQYSAMMLSTVVILVGAVFAFFTAQGGATVNGAFSGAAIAMGLALVLAFGVESGGQFRRLLRVDAFMFLALYVLIFFEFLFPQRTIATLDLDSARTGVLAALVGFAGLAIGRLAFRPRQSLPDARDLKVSPGTTFGILIFLAFFAYLYMLVAVKFNVVEMVEFMLRPRFSQPWARGRLGGVNTLLHEVGLLKYTLAPITGVILSQSRKYSGLQILVTTAVLLFVLFDGFVSGTRHIFIIFLATFVVSYLITAPRLGFGKILLVTIPAAALFFIAVTLMLASRNKGFAPATLNLESVTTEALFVDMNIVNIARLTQAFPGDFPYLGLEIPYNMLVRPIPRAFWSGKPEGLSVGIEKALGVGDYMTLSATFVGEFWMAGGLLAVALGAIMLGMIAGAWNRFGSRADTNLRFMIYVIGFFPALLCMRSFLSVGPALLPVIGMFVLLSVVGSGRGRGRRKPARL